MLKKRLRPLVRKAKHVKNLTYPYLKNLALDAGLLRGHTNYTRFIILGRARVGSNFLRGLLNAHSQVVVFGELFQNKDEIGWAMPGFRQSPRLMRLFNENPVAFLEQKVFKPFTPATGAVGFKIFYYHAQDEKWRPVWEYLQREKGVKVIHVKRRNILKTHLSRQRAMMTGVWVNTGGARSNGLPPIKLDYEACLQDFRQTRAWEAKHDAFFADHETIDVIYEDLAADYERKMEKIQAFLGVDTEGVTPETHKQARRPLSEAIANYHELKAQFSGTPWETFFEE